MLSLDLLVLGAVAVGSFLSSSMDSLAFLVPVISSGEARKRSIVAGYLSALTIIVVVSWGVGQLGESYLPFETGWLGLIPLTIGVWMLVRRVAAPTSGAAVAGQAIGATGTLVVTLSMSGDNLGVFVPLFADTDVAGDLLIVGTLILCGVLWSGLAGFVATRPKISELAERWGPWVMPFILMAVGLFILADTAADLK